METIIDGERHHKGYEDDGSESDLGSAETALESLEYMNIYYMDNLSSIWRGPNGFGYMPKLKILALHTCPRLIYIFSHSMLENFVYLEELILEDCPLVTSLVNDASVNPMMSDKFLPNLKRLLLLYLPQLVTIWNGLPIAPKLESIGFYNCPKLKSISKMELSSKILKIIKGESQWWEDMNWDESEWGNRLDYLMQIFSPINHEQDVMTQMAEDRDLFEASIQNESKILDYLGDRITGTEVTKPSTSECISVLGLEEPERAWSSSSEKKRLEDDESDIASDISELDDGEDKIVAKKRNCAENENKATTVTDSVSKPRRGGKALFRIRSEHEVFDDGFRWRSYEMKGILHKWKYWKCSTLGCPVKKMVKRDPQDTSFCIVKYKGVHNHDMPRDKYYNRLSQGLHQHWGGNVEDAAETAQNMISFTKEDENSLQGSTQEDNRQLDQMMTTNKRNTIASPLPTLSSPPYSTIRSASLVKPPMLSHNPLTETSDVSLSSTTTDEFAAQSLNQKSHSDKEETKTISHNNSSDASLFPQSSPLFHPSPSKISQLSATTFPTHMQSVKNHPKQDASMCKLQEADSKQHPRSPMRRKSDEGYSWSYDGFTLCRGNIISRYYKCASDGCPAKKIDERSLDGQIANVVLHAKHNHLESQSKPARTSSLSAFSKSIGAPSRLTIKIPDKSFVFHAKQKHLGSQSHPTRTSSPSAFCQNFRASNHLTIKIPDKSFVTYEGREIVSEAAPLDCKKPAIIHTQPCDESSKGKRKRLRAKTTPFTFRADLATDSTYGIVSLDNFTPPYIN